MGLYLSVGMRGRLVLLGGSSLPYNSLCITLQHMGHVFPQSVHSAIHFLQKILSQQPNHTGSLMPERHMGQSFSQGSSTVKVSTVPWVLWMCTVSMVWHTLLHRLDIGTPL